MSTDLEPIINYYTNLLIIQYKEQPKARAMVAMAIKVLLCNGTMFDIMDGFGLGFKRASAQSAVRSLLMQKLQ